MRFTQAVIEYWSTTIMKVVVLLCMVLIGAVGYLRWQGFELLSVQSGSMTPQIRRGSAVLVNRQERLPRVGDVVSYTSPRNEKVIITHRVIAADLKRGIFTTKGDQTYISDPPAPMRNIIGEVHGNIPLLGYLLSSLRHPLGLMIAVYVPALGIILAEVRRLAMHYSGLGVERYIIHPALRKL